MVAETVRQSGLFYWEKIMKFTRRTLIAAAAVSAITAMAPTFSSVAQAAEKTDITIAVGGKSLYYYLPLTIAERLGYFKDEGLNVKIVDFQGGSRSLQAVVGGSADVVSGAFEHTISMQAKKQPMTAFVLQGRAPQLTMVVSNKRMPDYKQLSDLKGKKIGVTAPGSSSQMVANYILAKGGLTPKDVAFIGVGSSSGAVAALRSGQIDALINLDPVITILTKSGDAKIVADTRKVKESESFFGGTLPAGCLYAPASFVEKNPKTVQALTNAIVRADQWISKASAEDVAKVVPESYLMGNRDIYLAGFEGNREALSPDGKFPDGCAKISLNALTTVNDKIDPSKIDLNKVYTNKFVEEALKKYPAK